jgi:hypothetical protein
MSNEPALPTNRALLHEALTDETAKQLVVLTGHAADESEMTALIRQAMEERLGDVMKELDGAPPAMA